MNRRMVVAAGPLVHRKNTTNNCSFGPMAFQLFYGRSFLNMNNGEHWFVHHRNGDTKLIAPSNESRLSFPDVRTRLDNGYDVISVGHNVAQDAVPLPGTSTEHEYCSLSYLTGITQVRLYPDGTTSLSARVSIVAHADFRRDHAMLYVPSSKLLNTRV